MPVAAARGIMARVPAAATRKSRSGTAGPHAEVVEAVAKEAEKQGIYIKVVEFSDYITPDKALADGDIDLVSYQHKPFLDNFNKQNGTDLVPIGNTILMRMGIYSANIRARCFARRRCHRHSQRPDQWAAAVWHSSSGQAS